MKSKKIKISIIIIIGLAVPFWVIWNNIFPSFSFNFDLNQDNRNRIEEKIINKKRYIIFPVNILETNKDYFFDKVNLYLKTKNKLSQNEIHVEATDSFETLLYPIGKEITEKDELNGFLHYNNSTQYPNGTIFAFDNSAYIISRGQYMPIFSADIFVRNGFYWDKLIQANSDLMANLQEGEEINFYSPHPDGTILRVDEKNYYLVWEKQLLPVSPQILAEIWPGFNWADIKSARSLAGSCHLNKKINCFFSDYTKRQGSAYLFEIKDDIGEINEVEVDLKISIKRNLVETFILFLSRVKSNLIYKYGKYL